MTTLRVILDQVASPEPGGIGRYAEELTRALIHTAPPGCDVEGVVPASSEDVYEHIAASLPGLGALYKSPLDRRSLAAAWQHGFTTLPGKGMIHAMSLLAPLHRHDRVNENEQIAVTMHDVVAWTHPETLSPRRVSWNLAMAKRARKYADAVVVPTHAVATQLSEFVDFGDRVRVIGGAVSGRLRLPDDVDARAAALDLPEQYVLAVGTLEPRKGLDALIAAMGMPSAPDIPLLIVGPEKSADRSVAELREQAGLDEHRVRTLGHLSDEDLAVVIRRASVFVFPSRAEGFGLSVIEAFALGTPVIHSDAPSLLEISAEAGLAVLLAEPDAYPERLADAVARVVGDDDLRATMRTLGQDRARAFSWTASAEKVWQLHADL